jgi:hypothetical protein
MRDGAMALLESRGAEVRMLQSSGSASAHRVATVPCALLDILSAG